MENKNSQMLTGLGSLTDTHERWDTIIQPPKGKISLDLRELWEYRELLYFFVWRSLKVRYKQTALGAAWAIIQPFVTMVVFSIFFGRLAQVPSDGVPYPIFAYTALVPWTYFADSLSRASNSLVENERMITKIYFPRLFLPLSVVCAGLVDFAISFLLLIGMMAWYGLTPQAVWAVPLFTLMAMATALSVSLWLSALNVQYRDVRYAVTFIIQFWLFATPVAYPSSLVPEQWRTLYGLNPMVGVVEGFRWALLGNTPAPPGGTLAVSLFMVLVLLGGGLYYFRRLENTFADVV